MRGFPQVGIRAQAIEHGLHTFLTAPPSCHLIPLTLCRQPSKLVLILVIVHACTPLDILPLPLLPCVTVPFPFSILLAILVFIILVFILLLISLTGITPKERGRRSGPRLAPLEVFRLLREKLAFTEFEAILSQASLSPLCSGVRSPDYEACKDRIDGEDS